MIGFREMRNKFIILLSSILFCFQEFDILTLVPASKLRIIMLLTKCIFSFVDNQSFTEQFDDEAVILWPSLLHYKQLL
jgi:hypothetical protein